MADVAIKYNGSNIATMEDSGIKTLRTGGKYVAGDIDIEYTKPSGGAETPEVQPKDVNFYGLGARLLYSYTLAEAQALPALPDLPTEAINCVPMTYDWVETLANINGLTSADIPYNICIAAKPTDGKTHIHIKLTEGRLSPYLGIAVNGSVNIDWGDGTTHDTVTGERTDYTLYTLHTYASVGEYDVVLDVTGNAFITGSSSSGSKFLSKSVENKFQNRLEVLQSFAVSKRHSNTNSLLVQ